MNGPMGRGRIIVFFVEKPGYLPADFIRSKIHGFILKRTVGHKNANQNHGHVRLFLLSTSIPIICSNFSCKANA